MHSHSRREGERCVCFRERGAFDALQGERCLGTIAFAHRSAWQQDMPAKKAGNKTCRQQDMPALDLSPKSKTQQDMPALRQQDMPALDLSPKS
jgi:hypothetical protein